MGSRRGLWGLCATWTPLNSPRSQLSDEPPADSGRFKRRPPGLPTRPAVGARWNGVYPMTCRSLIVLVALGALAPPTHAGIFSRKPKANPAERVPELLIELKGATDEAQSSTAAEEFRQS